MRDPIDDYPRLTRHGVGGRVLAISASMAWIPAYRDLPQEGLKEMRHRTEQEGGFVMQKDDPYLPAFSLFSFTGSKA